METTPAKDHYTVLIVGGGSAGITVAAHLLQANDAPEVGIIEPASKHYYQPIWTLVGAGAVEKASSARDMAEVIPPGADWMQDRAVEFAPEQNTVSTAQGHTVTYDYLVVAMGIQLDWDHIPGLAESVGKPGTGVCSNYSYDTVDSTWENIRNFSGGRAIFTQPATAIKCGGAPQKIMYLADEAFRRQGVREQSEIFFCTAKPAIFSVDKYARTLKEIIKRKDLKPQYEHDLKAIDADRKEASFDHQGEDVTFSYDLLHVTPPMSAPDILKESPLANEEGWVDVHKYSLQHNTYDNVFALGDCSSLPTSKTGAAVRKQAPTVVKNLQALRHGQPLDAQYDGYTSCPLVTGYGSLVLAEFSGYTGEPMETFPFDQSQERYSMYVMKKNGLPNLYWHGMLKGRA